MPAVRSNAVPALLCATALAVIIVLLGARPAHATSFAVNSTADAVDAAAGDGACAAADGACTLRAAVMEANARAATGPPSTVVIHVPAGTYVLADAGAPGSLDDRNEDGAATGDLDFNGGKVMVRGAGPGETVLDGNGVDRLFHLGPSKPTRFSLAGVTVRNGSVVSDPPSRIPGGPDVGGGLRIERNSGLTIRNAVFEANHAGARGGAIGMPPSAATADGADPEITTVIADVAMRGNSAGVEAGALFNNRVAILSKVLIEDNRVTGTVGDERGGAIAQSGDLFLTDAIVRNNSIPAGNGGGIANRGDPRAQIFGHIELTNVTVSGNVAAVAGGIGLGNGSTGTLVNTTLSGNCAPSGGGELANLGTVTVTNSTIVGSSSPAQCGGGLVTLGPPAGAPNARATLSRTILQRGKPNCVPPPPPFARLPVSAGDNISSDGSCQLTGAGDLNGIDPRLGPLSMNGGFSPTHALMLGSPAIDGALNSACPPPATDQRGVVRPQGLRCDIGAYELEVGE